MSVREIMQITAHDWNVAHSHKDSLQPSTAISLIRLLLDTSRWFADLHFSLTAQQTQPQIWQM